MYYVDEATGFSSLLGELVYMRRIQYPLFKFCIGCYTGRQMRKVYIYNYNLHNSNIICRHVILSSGGWAPEAFKETVYPTELQSYTDSDSPEGLRIN